jgi:demethylmenaquinone methyltransferase/2-methoxy-6-polyprenyl-1,4-benzoquinol methylase
MTNNPIRPHPTLKRYYHSDDERAALVRRLFDSGAPSYEWICNLMSFGTGERYRRQVLVDSGVSNTSRVLDVATGTGLVLRSLDELTSSGGIAIGLDPSWGMLTQCRARCEVPLVQAVAERLPFINRSFDTITMGYGLRHVEDLRLLFSEFHRILSPGGKIVILELIQPQSRLARMVNRFYLKTFLPRMSYLMTQSRDARRMMEYFWDTIENCVSPRIVLEALQDCGFVDGRQKVSFGTLCEYIAIRSN